MLVLLALTAGCTSAAPRGQSPTQVCTVTRVSDGDSLRALCPGLGGVTRIRLRGIDAPELRQRYGQQARQAVLALCQKQAIRIPARPARDRYQRVLADVHCGGVDVSLRLVQSGLAWVYRPTAAEYPRLVQAERRAQRARLGLWGDAHPVAPWTWRRQHANR